MDLLSEMERTISRNLLKYAAGHHIFCPGCDAIMDCTRTVIVSAGSREIVRCTTCWDAARLLVEASAAVEGKYSVLDGRMLWPAKRRKTR